NQRRRSGLHSAFISGFPSGSGMPYSASAPEAVPNTDAGTIRAVDVGCCNRLRNGRFRSYEGAGGALIGRTGKKQVGGQGRRFVAFAGSEEGKKWAWEDSNLRPHRYQRCALTN